MRTFFRVRPKVLYLPSALYCSPHEKLGPHVEPVLETDAGHGDLAGSPGLLPGEMFGHRGPLTLDLALQALQEHAVVVQHGDVVQVVLLPPSDVPEQLIDRRDIFLLAHRGQRSEIRGSGKQVCYLNITSVGLIETFEQEG